ncbi:hypothetical protein D3C73_1316770 [compost metagenome]
MLTMQVLLKQNSANAYDVSFAKANSANAYEVSFAKAKLLGGDIYERQISDNWEWFSCSWPDACF